MRVLHLPTPICGMPYALSRGEIRLGLDSSVLAVKQSIYQEACDRVLIEQERAGITGRIDVLKARVNEAYHIRGNYDVLHFNSGSSLIDYPLGGIDLLDVPLYSKEKIFVTYNGCDARMAYAALSEVYPDGVCRYCENSPCKAKSKDKRKSNRINRFDKFADGIFAVNPDLLQFLPERAVFLPYAVVTAQNIVPHQRDHGKGRFVVAHAPTNRAIKGTSFVLDAVAKAKMRCSGLEFDIIENCTHEQALTRYAAADLMIDQLHCGWYGGLAVEVMQMGIPVAAFVRESDLCFIPQDMAAELKNAMINVTPSSLADTICYYYENRTALEQKRQFQLEYSNKWHDPVYVASITKQAYENV